MAWCVVWAVSEGASVVASDIHSSAVSESEARSREAASARWDSETDVRCDTISFQAPSELDVGCFPFGSAGSWEFVVVVGDGSVFCISCAWNLGPHFVQFSIWRS